MQFLFALAARIYRKWIQMEVLTGTIGNALHYIASMKCAVKSMEFCSDLTELIMVLESCIFKRH